MTATDLNASRFTILVVEDEVDTATSLAELLSLHGYGVEVAFNGREALEALARCSPAVILLDIWMPVMDGCEVARRIRERPGGDPRPFLVAVTGYESPDSAHESVRALFDLYLIKPVEPAVLIGVLERIRRFHSGGPAEYPRSADEPTDAIDYRTDDGRPQFFTRALESILQPSPAPAFP
jgi:CheY-like chemotaxis protein